MYIRWAVVSLNVSQLCLAASSEKLPDCDTDPVDVSAALSFALFFSPLTKVKLINELNEREASLGVNETVSWHSVYKDSAWIFIGKIN